MRRSMISYIKRRELFVDCPHSGVVRGRPQRGRGRARKRPKPLGKQHETKSQLEHLIKSIEERALAARRCRAGRRGQRIWLTIRFRQPPTAISKPKRCRQAITSP